MASLERHAFHGEEAKTLADGELHAVLELDPDPPGSQAPFRAVVPESRWDDVRLLEG